MIFLLTMALCFAELNNTNQYLRWASLLEPEEHPEQGYRFYPEIHAQIAKSIKNSGRIVEVINIGRTVQNRSIWAFKINPSKTKYYSVFILGGIHPIEWVSIESTVELLLSLTEHPPEHTEVIVVPVLNIDRRLVVEQDLISGERKYRRVNSGGEDLNRDYAVHREATAIWRHLFPERYTTSSAVLSQPETKAIDQLFSKYQFDAAISVHAFGGYIYYPWAGRYDRIPDWKEHHHLGTVMKEAQIGKHPYRVKQLSHWMFLFRAQGTELDHFYEKYGARSFLIETTRSGIQWWKRDDWKDPFRLYNPRNPDLDIQRTANSMWALIHHYDHLPELKDRDCSCQVLPNE